MYVCSAVPLFGLKKLGQFTANFDDFAEWVMIVLSPNWFAV